MCGVFHSESLLLFFDQLEYIKYLLVTGMWNYSEKGKRKSCWHINDPTITRRIYRRGTTEA